MCHKFTLLCSQEPPQLSFLPIPPQTEQLIISVPLFGHLFIWHYLLNVALVSVKH